MSRTVPPRREWARIAPQTRRRAVAVECGRRLVEHDQPWSAAEGERDADPTPLSRREAADLPPLQIREAEAPDDDVRPHRVLVVTADQRDQLAHAQRCRQRGLLRRDADVAPCLRPAWVDAEEPRTAAVGSPQPEQHCERSRLPGAVRAEHGDRLPVPDREGRVVERDPLPEALRDRVQPGNRHGWTPTPPVRSETRRARGDERRCTTSGPRCSRRAHPCRGRARRTAVPVARWMPAARWASANPSVLTASAARPPAARHSPSTTRRQTSSSFAAQRPMKPCRASRMPTDAERPPARATAHDEERPAPCRRPRRARRPPARRRDRTAAADRTRRATRTQPQCRRPPEPEGPDAHRLPPSAIA